MQLLILLSLLGLVLSLYAVWVHWHVTHETRGKRYKPLCDIHEKVSCSRAFASEHATKLRIHNGWIGVIFYLVVLVFAFLNYTTAIFFLSIFAVAASLYLAYLSYVKMKNFCLVCTMVYAVNLALLILTPVAF